MYRDPVCYLCDPAAQQLVRLLLLPTDSKPVGVQKKRSKQLVSLVSKIQTDDYEGSG